MTLLGLLGIFIGLAALPLAIVERTRLRVVVFTLAFLLHVACAIVYYLYARDNGADTQLYYYDMLGMYKDGFGASTQFVIWVVQTIRQTVGGTYLDYFLLFQAVGFFGIAALMRIFEEIYSELQLPQPAWVHGLLFLPGIHFWTSAIGKDALLFTACCLAIWSTMQMRRRYLTLSFSIVLMLLIRPHIALVAVIAIAWTVFGDRRTRPLMRALLLAASAAALAAAAATIRDALYIDLTDADSVSNFLAARESFLTSDDVGNTAVIGAAYPVRLASFLLRPFFWDAEDAFGYIASFENVILFVVLSAILFQARTVAAAMKSVMFVRYALMFSVGVTLALAIDYYNVGLGLRQKTMVVSGYLVVFVAMVALRGAARRATSEMQMVVSAKPLVA